MLFFCWIYRFTGSLAPLESPMRTLIVNLLLSRNFLKIWTPLKVDLCTLFQSITHYIQTLMDVLFYRLTSKSKLEIRCVAVEQFTEDVAGNLKEAIKVLQSENTFVVATDSPPLQVSPALKTLWYWLVFTSLLNTWPVWQGRFNLFFLKCTVHTDNFSSGTF